MNKQPRMLSILTLIVVSAPTSLYAEADTYCKRSKGGLTDYNDCIKVTEDEAVPVDIYGRRTKIKGKRRTNESTFCDQSSGGNVNYNKCHKVVDGKLYPVDIYGRKLSTTGVDVSNTYKKIDR
ncbi:hypothetical protein FV139_17645 [Parahaliea maris]|uniref:Uncharacterized protein n=1 Tax=Parahaliea maris TaxID=2716870 RepID=A0A5C8ZQR5_9GAMM|nr:hypothetical protein [Parahaliea maris]TXS90798.1 hypothetical protein FV139_17645 [Parahaliea maris]